MASFSRFDLVCGGGSRGAARGVNAGIGSSSRALGFAIRTRQIEVAIVVTGDVLASWGEPQGVELANRAASVLGPFLEGVGARPGERWSAILQADQPPMLRRFGLACEASPLRDELVGPEGLES